MLSGCFRAIKLGLPSAPVPKAPETQRKLKIPLGVLPTATLEGMVPPPREAEPVHILALKASSSGAEPSAGADSISVEGALAWRP